MLTTLIVLMLAMVTLSISRSLLDETVRLPLVIISRFCLFISLIYVPWLMKFLILIAIFVIPVCTQRYSIRQGRCSRWCIARSHCSHPHG
ncbi:MAG: hypothetical protein KME16_01730 [Scytolyngbya sp. HA4215-MV1]|jgi:Na+-translocating ferredoxin:NAD+ oxidoreductase RnfE subunit|nr:hypothetical protein [Scytolyngbya sp. HA4215-MV1]